MPVNVDFFDNLVIDGGSVFNGRDTGKYLLSGGYSLTIDGLSEIAFEMRDPNLAFLSSFPGDRGPIGKKAVYGGLAYEIASISAGPGAAGDGQSTFRLRPEGIEKLKRVTGPLNRENISATQYVRDAVNRQGLKLVAQDTPVRPSIERDTKEGLGTGDDRNEWTTIQGLAGEEMFLAFEMHGTVYFASPKWLFEKQPNVKVAWCPPHMSAPTDAIRMMNAPDVDVSSKDKLEDEIGFSLPYSALGRLWPGHTITLVNVPNIDKKLLVTEVSYDLAASATGVIGVRARMPWELAKVERTKPQPQIDLSGMVGSGARGVGMGPGGGGKRFYASEICMAAKERNLGRDGARNGIATALVESNLTMYANYAVPESLKFPHEAVGSDHDSVGLFQQRQAGWGTLAERMNARASAGMFFNKMMTFNWRAMDPGAACQKVQVSAFPGKYSQRMAEAVQWVNQVY